MIWEQAQIYRQRRSKIRKAKFGGVDGPLNCGSGDLGVSPNLPLEGKQGTKSQVWRCRRCGWPIGVHSSGDLGVSPNLRSHKDKVQDWSNTRGREAKMGMGGLSKSR